MVIFYLVLIILFALFLIIYLKKKHELFIQRRELFFIHIPKNAGTSIEDVSKSQNILWGRHYKWKSIDNIKCNKWHIPPKYINNNDYKNKILFCIVRNPYNRIISEFQYNRIISEFQYISDYKYSATHLNDFISNLQSRYKNNSFMNDCHILPQIEYIKKSDNSINKDIIILRFENIEIDFKNLLEKYKYDDIKLSHSNKSKGGLSFKDLNKNSIKIINEMYNEDFKEFNYDKLDTF